MASRERECEVEAGRRQSTPASRGAGDSAPAVWFIAGDISGDQNAGRLAAAIRTQAPGIRLCGAGGPAMRAAGVEVAVETLQLSCVGVPGPRLIWEHVRVYRRLIAHLAATRPALVVLVDNEWTNLVVATLLRWHRVPVVFFFPPQVWMWGRWRLPAIVPLAQRVLSAFRAEADLYRAAGADTVWTGHPLRDVVRVEADSAAAVRAIGLDPSRPIAIIMPGSRYSEIRALAPEFFAAARALQQREPRLQFAVPLAAEWLRDEIAGHLRRSELRDAVVYAPSSYAVMGRAEVALQCSGTATVETALLGIPSVIAYRCTPFEYRCARRFMQCRFIGMVNILLDDMVQPEFFQADVDADRLAEAAWSLMRDAERRRALMARLADLPQLLGPPGVLTRAAQSVLQLLPAQIPDESPAEPSVAALAASPSA